MKRKALTTALLAGLTGVAGMTSVSNAVNINPDGLGQVMVYPFYSVNDGNQTLISVVNTTNQVKAVKVRFLEGMNTREVLDFNLYLSPWDVWTGNVRSSPSDDNLGQLVTTDTSCTVPDIVNSFPGGVDFRVFAYVSTANDGETESARRTREGHVEMIEMGVVTNITEGSAAAATHVGAPGAEVPLDCQQLQDAWFASGAAGYWAANPEVDMTAPNGGLFGGAYLLNVQGGTSAGYNAVAVDRHSSVIQHTRPDSTLPTIANANTNGSFLAVQSIVFDNVVNRDTDGDGDFDNGLVLTTWTDTNDAGADAVSAVFMHDQLFNEFIINDGIRAETEWVITFPTKRFYVDQALPRAPFTQAFDEGGACEDVSLTIYNREESPIDIRIDDFSPRPPSAPGPQLCWETNVLAWDQGLANQNIADPAADRTSILGASNWANVALPASGFSEGWAALGFPNNRTNLIENPNQQGHRYEGLPATGFSVVEFVNGDVGGSLSNYDSLFGHRATRDICVTGCS